MLTLPQILDIPEKLIPLITEINNYTYFIAEGGRGGGKSNAVGRLILYLGEKRKLRVVCGRETQNTIAESVYSLLVDLVTNFNLNYEVQANKLTHRESGTEITFRGFRQQGAFNIQGMEGIDIVWIDEAQAITKETIDRLIPTIRKNTSKIYFTMNRHVIDDPAFEYCSGRPDCLHLHINYDENKFCTDKLKRDAETCLKKSKEDYEHIWMGKPLDKSEDAVFAYDDLLATSLNRYQLRNGYGMRIAGFDVARYGDDKCCFLVIQQMGALHWEVMHVEEWGQKDMCYSTGRFNELMATHKVTRAIVDEDGIGGSVLDTMTHGRGLTNITGFRNPAISYQDNKDYANNRTVNTYKLKDLVLKGHMAMTDIDLMKELCTMRYTFDHQQRKILVSKDVMRTKFKIKSPNKADALIMAASLINEVKTQQDVQYSPRHQAYKDDNIFSSAGIR